MTDRSRTFTDDSASASNNGATDRFADPLSGVVSSVQEESLLQMQTGLFNLGRNRALQSGTTSQRGEDVVTLTDHARAMARQTYRDKYDPSQNAHDAMYDAEYQRDLAQRSDAEETEQHAAANLRDAEIRLSKTPEAGPKPRAHPALVVSFVVAITLSVAPTTHDSIFLTLGDDLLAWFAAISTSAFVALMLTLAILSGRRTKWTWVGVAAGVILGLGLGAVRLSGANGANEEILAVGLTIVEIAAVLLLEWLAGGLRVSEAEWFPLHSARREATAVRDAAEDYLKRCQCRVKELDESIARKIAFVENRHNRNIQLPELEGVAIKAVMDGYNAGITENVGHLRGVRFMTRGTE